MPQLLKRLARAVLLLCALVLGGSAAPASAAPLAIQQLFAGPIASDSPCTAEPKLPENGNAGPYDPARLTGDLNPINLPGREDVVGRSEAGAFVDQCVAFSLDSDYSRGYRPPNYTGPYVSPSNPATHWGTGDDLRDLDVILPPGYGARLADVPVCSDEAFGLAPAGYYVPVLTSVYNVGRESPTDPDDGYDAQPFWVAPATCPDSSLVGTAWSRATVRIAISQALAGGAGYYDLGDGSEPTLRSGVWPLAPAPNELGRLGVQIYQPDYALVKFVVALRLAPDGSGRVMASVRHLPRNARIPGISTAGESIYIESAAIRLFGAVSEHPEFSYFDDEYEVGVRYPALAHNFMETPTRCDAPATGTVTGQTYGGAFKNLESTYTPTPLSATVAGTQFTGCDQLPFAPAVDVEVAERVPGVPTAATVRVRVDQAAVGGRLPSHLKDASVTLPAGLELGGQVASDADGLQFCSAAEFAEGDVTVAASCAAATQAATVAVTTPLISRQFTGKVFLGEPASGDVLPQLFLEAQLAGSSGADAPRFKLVGRVVADADGRLTATFTGAPQLRWSELTLTFPGGDHALFSTAPRCGSTSGSARMTPWSGQPDVSVATSQVVIDQGCGAAAVPSIGVVASNPKAGAKSPVAVTIERDSSAPWMDSVNAHLPSGFLADLNAAKECPSADAATGNCSADTRIGSVTTWAGAGPAPFEISGDLFLAERKGTDVAGAVIVVDAKVGDLDLGKVVVPGRILLRPTDAGLDFIADVPLRVQGVALQIQKVRVDLDRPNFALNPSACGPLEASVELTDDQSVVTSGTGQASYTGCKDLGFTPKLQAILTGDNTPGGHPGMFVVLTSPEGDAGMKSATVTLPDGVVVDLQNAKNSCTVAQFNSSTCPASAQIGTANAQVSIVPDELTGAIYLVAIPGKSLPGLGLDFGGRYSQRVLATTATNKDSRVVTSFASIPDLPLRRLTIDVTSNAKSPLQVSETSPCDANSGWEGAFTAQGGQSSTGRSGLQCAAKPKTLLSSKSGLSFRLFDFGTRNLSYLKVALPKGWSFNAKAAKRPDALWVRATGGSAEIKLAKRSLFVYATGKTTDVRLKIAASAINAPRKIKRGTKVNLPVRLAFTDGTIQQQTASITLK